MLMEEGRFKMLRDPILYCISIYVYFYASLASAGQDLNYMGWADASQVQPAEVPVGMAPQAWFPARSELQRNGTRAELDSWTCKTNI